MADRGLKALKSWAIFIIVLFKARQKDEGKLLIPAKEVDALEDSLSRGEEKIYAPFLIKARRAKKQKNIQELICTATKVLQKKAGKVDSESLHRIYLLLKASKEIKEAGEKSGE